MRILVKKALRDLWQAKLRTISIILAIILSLGMGIGLVNATQDAFETFNGRFDNTNYEDIDIHFEITAVNISEINELEGVEAAMGRLFIPSQVSIADKKYEAHWISAPFYPTEPYSQINGYSLDDGNYFTSKNSREGLIGNLFAKENGIETGAKLTILHGNISIELNISGVVGSPEYIYVVSDAGWPQPSLLLPLFTTYEMAVEELGLENGTYNELLIRVEKGSNVKEVKGKIEELLTKKDVRITRSILGTEEMDYQFSKADADGMGKMGWAFGIIILVVTGVVIYNAMTRLISYQRSYIGVMGALGGKRGTILFHYTMFGLFMGIIGSFLGIFAGIGMSYLIVYGYTSILGLLNPVYTIFWIYPVIFVLAGIVICTGAAFFGALKAVKIGPREALTSNYHAQAFSKKPVIEKLFDIFSRKRRIMPRITVRNLSRNRARTILTVVALGFSMILVFSTLALATNFHQPIEKNYGEYETWDLETGLAYSMKREEVAEIL
ncbi:MAG: ABC transporter permease, partial [Candidatus Thermoplasmatota archaeon]|nr:ABC transporter permease [Candidatus Thermoplasmatota archaeon]